ncbi:MAG: hypothetical protein DMF00_05425 [Verrucomicrobia bacterium]|nr:MAG: hypothetical protein DMF00_05425 [Verrucomicrobiota bacterium]
MARKCSSQGCAFYLPNSYPLEECPWHAAPGSGPVKIAAAIAIAAAGLGGGIAYKKFREYLREKKLRQQRYAASSESVKKASSKQRKRKSKSSTRKKPRPAKPRLSTANGA